MPEPEGGREPVEREGFSYLPAFISQTESEELIDYFAELHPLWEQRHQGGHADRSGGQQRRLTRPVYWLGAWQFACLGYYAEPDHRVDRCVAAEAFPSVMTRILERLLPVLRESHQDNELKEAPNTCLINYYGREVGQGVPRDYARLRMHRDGEPGPVLMFNIGQPALLEFLDPQRSPDPELSLWVRHRSAVLISGPDFKDRLYHRVTQVRTGKLPELRSQLPRFETRRVSVSFRYVPEELISDYGKLPLTARTQVRDYVEELALHSAHFRVQLDKGQGIA